MISWRLSAIKRFGGERESPPIIVSGLLSPYVSIECLVSEVPPRWKRAGYFQAQINSVGITALSICNELILINQRQQFTLEQLPENQIYRIRFQAMHWFDRNGYIKIYQGRMMQ